VYHIVAQRSVIYCCTTHYNVVSRNAVLAMTKRPVTIYIESGLYDRIKKTKQLREKLLPPGWPKVSSYSAHLIEEGLRVEEATLQEVQKKGISGKNGGIVGVH